MLDLHFPSEVQGCLSHSSILYATMELVKEIVKKAMPSLSDDLMDSLMARLEEIGVNGVDDLNFVKTEDIRSNSATHSA